MCRVSAYLLCLNGATNCESWQRLNRTPLCHCRMLYRATPAWDEPTEVREMLDASDELDAIPEDAVRIPCSH